MELTLDPSSARGGRTGPWWLLRWPPLGPQTERPKAWEGPPHRRWPPWLTLDLLNLLFFNLNLLCSALVGGRCSNEKWLVGRSVSRSVGLSYDSQSFVWIRLILLRLSSDRSYDGRSTFAGIRLIRSFCKVGRWVSRFRDNLKFERKLINLEKFRFWRVSVCYA